MKKCYLREEWLGERTDGEDHSMERTRTGGEDHSMGRT